MWMLPVAHMLLCQWQAVDCLHLLGCSAVLLVQMQAVPKASGVKAKVQAATAPLQQASTAKQPPKGHSAVDAAAAVVSAGASSTSDKEVQVRKAASVLAPPA